MTPDLLLDTHVLIRWLFESRRLSKEQARVLDAATQRGDSLGISAISLTETAEIWRSGRLQLRTSLEEFFEDLQSNPCVRVLPLTFEIAADYAALAALRDPADRIIVATARVHRMKLLTSDQRIIDSGLCGTIG